MDKKSMELISSDRSEECLFFAFTMVVQKHVDRFLLWGLITFDLWYRVQIRGLNCDRLSTLFRVLQKDEVQ